MIVVIVDYGMGNLGSILNMLKKIGADAVISSDISIIKKADKLILPGIGAFDSGMKHINELGMIPALTEKALHGKTPLLGICLGMQLLTKGSEEGNLPGLGFIDADTIKFKFEGEQRKLKIPHMGWNIVNISKDNVLYKNMYKEPRFYFVHSYHVICHNHNDIATTTPYGFDLVSSFHHENIMGTQFHPEKSHKFGKRLLENFVEL